MLFRSIIFVSLVLSASTSAFARGDESLRCDRDQNICIVENKRLVIGDEVAFFNTDQEIVAYGEVSEMDGRDRKILINRKLGSISRSDRVELLASNPVLTSAEPVKLYKAPGRYAAGGSLGLSPINIAADAVAYSGEAFGHYLWRRGILLTGRVHGFSASGAIDTGEQRSESGDYSTTGMLFMSGVGYRLFPKKPISIRPTLELGFSYISTTTTASSYPSSIDKAGNGLGLAGRVGTDLIYTKFGDWQPLGSVGFSKVNQARATTIAIGVIRDIK